VKEELLRMLRNKTGISYTSLERDLQNAKSEPILEEQQDITQTKIAETASGTDKQVKAIRFILAAKLFSVPYALDFSLKELPVTNETHKEIVAYITEREEKGERIRPSELLEVIDGNNEELGAIFNLNYDDKLTGATAQRFFEDSVKSITQETLDKQIALYTASYEAETDADKKKQWAQKIAECMQKKKKLNKK
jgi:hypothetical protein